MRPHDDDLTGAQTHTESALNRPHVVAMWPGGSVSKELAHDATLTVGRSKRCDLVIDHPSVSREHAIFHGGPAVAIEDLGSTNGTTVGGARVPSNGRMTIEHGQVVAIGTALIVVRGGLPQRAPSRREPAGRPRSQASVVVVDAAVKEIHRIVDLVAKGDLSVVLLGETGVGKEVIADAIHRRSPRAAASYVRVNCAALPDALLESELFGYERGAFTGASQAKPGLLEMAQGGTVFLDEIAELPLSMQSKLLCVLENHEVMRVGGLKPRPIDVRFIAATNRDLAQLVREGSFRQDLYFRLNGIAITIPPLRDRPREVAPLAREFVSVACRDAGRALLTIDGDALAWLEQHDWPGNVRELRNVMQRAVMLCEADAIQLRHLLPESAFGDRRRDGDRVSEHPVSEPPPTMKRLDHLEPAIAPGGLRDAARRAVETIERRKIADVMERCAGNQTRAAKLLGISRRTLVTRLTEYGFGRPLKDRDPQGL
jgi:transcriptional regulator with PAS, ATPase and Fis domain